MPTSLAAFAFAAVCATGTGDDWPRPDQKIECGPLTFEVYLSRTAHLFHVVDQLSRWDNACHGQYFEHMPLSPEDEEILARYAEVRAKRRWGQGLEQTFYVPLSLDAAIKAGVKDGHVTAAEIAAIRTALDHFAARVDELMKSHRDALERAFTTIDRTRMGEAARRVARFVGVKKLAIPTFPLASPARGGGGMDGGRLRWELHDERPSFSVLLHEATHAFFATKDALLQKTVAATPGLDMTLLGEGFAYAVAPGLYPDGDQDELLQNVARDRATQEAWEDPTYGRQRCYALALRPLLKQALDESTVEAFLPRASDVFRALHEVEERTREAGRPPRLGIAGAGAQAIRDRLGAKFPLWIKDVDLGGYAELLDELARGDCLVILVAGDDALEVLPAAGADVLPMPVAKIRSRLGKGESFVEERATERGLRVILLAAPTPSALEKLARTTSRLDA